MNGRRIRAITLTDAGLRAIGAPLIRRVPLVDLPWRDDRKDRR